MHLLFVDYQNNYIP